MAILEDAGVFGEEAEQKAGQERVERVPFLIALDVVGFLQVVVEAGQLLCGLAVRGVLVDHSRLLQSRPRQEIGVMLVQLIKRRLQWSGPAAHVLREEGLEVGDDDEALLVGRLLRGMLHGDVKVLAFDGLEEDFGFELNHTGFLAHVGGALHGAGHRGLGQAIGEQQLVDEGVFAPGDHEGLHVGFDLANVHSVQVRTLNLQKGWRRLGDVEGRPVQPLPFLPGVRPVADEIEAHLHWPTYPMVFPIATQ